MVEMTDRARRRLEAYLREVRRSLRGRSDLDADTVLGGLREHVDAQLADRGPGGEPVAAAEMDRVLERLGAPDALAAGGGPVGGGAAVADGPPGWDAMGRRLLRLAVTLALAAAVAALLLAPGSLAWGQAQIGGVLDAARNPGAPPIPGTRPAAYWVWVAGLVSLVTGAWWVALGLAAARWGEPLRRATEPFSLPIEPRHGRVLAGVGGVLAAAGLAVLLL